MHWSGWDMISVEDPRGWRTSYTYHEMPDKSKRIEAVEFPNGGRYSYVYSGWQVVGLVDQLGHRSTLVWDGDPAMRTAVVDALGHRTSYSYSGGQITAIANRLGQRTTNVYDSLGRKIAVVDPLQQRTTYAYNAHSQVLRVGKASSPPASRS